MVMHPFFGDSKTLGKYRARMQAYIVADELVQGLGLELSDGRARGCFVCCVLDRYEHAGFPIELNLPLEIAGLCDALHEGLPYSRVGEFSSRFFAEVNVQGDASLWWPKFVIRLLTDPVYGMRQYADNPDIVDDVVRLYRRIILGDHPRYEEWAAVRTAASNAAWIAARNAAGGAAARAVTRAAEWEVTRNAARNAEWDAAENVLWESPRNVLWNAIQATVRAVARNAAEAAAQASEWGDATVFHYIWQSETLLQIIKD